MIKCDGHSENCCQWYHGHCVGITTAEGRILDVDKRLANLLSAKHSLSYGIVMGWLRCKLSFSLLRSAIMCIRGARSSLRCPIAEAPIAVQVAEAHYYIILYLLLCSNQKIITHGCDHKSYLSYYKTH